MASFLREELSHMVRQMQWLMVALGLGGCSYTMVQEPPMMSRMVDGIKNFIQNDAVYTYPQFNYSPQPSLLVDGGEDVLVREKPIYSQGLSVGDGVYSPSLPIPGVVTRPGVRPGEWGPLLFLPQWSTGEVQQPNVR